MHRDSGQGRLQKSSKRRSALILYNNVACGCYSSYSTMAQDYPPRTSPNSERPYQSHAIRTRKSRALSHANGLNRLGEDSSQPYKGLSAYGLREGCRPQYPESPIHCVSFFEGIYIYICIWSPPPPKIYTRLFHIFIYMYVYTHTNTTSANQ